MSDTAGTTKGATHAVSVRRDPSSAGQSDALSKVIGNPDASAEPFATPAEQRAAMNDPRYRESAEYRASVIQRINAGMQGRQSATSSTLPGAQPSMHPGLAKVYRHSVSDNNADVSVSRTLETLDVRPFLTRAERNAAFRDPRYQRDGSYRALVAAKIAVTDSRNLL